LQPDLVSSRRSRPSVGKARGGCVREQLTRDRPCTCELEFPISLAAFDYGATVNKGAAAHPAAAHSPPLTQPQVEIASATHQRHRSWCGLACLAPTSMRVLPSEFSCGGLEVRANPACGAREHGNAPLDKCTAAVYRGAFTREPSFSSQRTAPAPVLRTLGR
jgi:hypothetical protein